MTFRYQQNKNSFTYTKAFQINPKMMAIICVEDKCIMTVNQRFTQLTGFSEHEVIGHSGIDVQILEKSDHEKFWWKIKQRKSILNEPLTILTKSKKIIEGRCSAQIVDVEDNMFALVIFDNLVNEQENFAPAVNRENHYRYIEEHDDVHAAIQVLMDRCEKDRLYFEKKFQDNVDKFVIPYISRLRDGHTDAIGFSLLEILEENLNDILSSFLPNLRTTCSDLTSQEIQVANLIRLGKKSKEISEILGISLSTVETHRNHIRKKLGIQANKSNLQSYLLSLKTI